MTKRTNTKATETIRFLTSNAEFMRKDAISEIDGAINRLQRARDDFEAGTVCYRILDSSRLDIAASKAAAAWETLINIKGVLAAIADQG